ncbi:hypothetical protein CCAX7_36660 [Capsulimonas corticalis]|uniref:Zinc-finger domain-containing protein n=2 Tax=Capsulimonas corticalis TaxID=2219043 RepID=A0A9N7QDV0_9BACT|nr:hypothetical protein CCAX7_36660 [Capsulimonas corticalis]
MSFKDLLHNTLGEEAHASDTELIELSAGVMHPELEPLIREHIGQCVQCAAELAELQATLSSWEDPLVIERRETRIHRAAVMRGADSNSWWTAIRDWVTLVGLRPALGAMAASDDSDELHFPIHEEDGTVVAGLLGVVQRRGPAYYVRLTTSHSLRDQYAGRQAEVVVADPETRKVLITRKATFYQFVLLGTDLQIDSQKIAARLLP